MNPWIRWLVAALAAAYVAAAALLAGALWMHAVPFAPSWLAVPAAVLWMGIGGVAVGALRVLAPARPAARPGRARTPAGRGAVPASLRA